MFEGGEISTLYLIGGMFWRIGTYIGLQSDNIVLADGGGGVFIVLGVDGGCRC